jgi:hypothetical protein
MSRLSGNHELRFASGIIDLGCDIFRGGNGKYNGLHPGKEKRTFPLFPDLREHLQAGFDPLAIYVVNERIRASAQGKAGWRNCNLRTQFERILKRAGLTPWPRLFHNLRSSRQSELAESIPTHVVCEWLGTSDDIARKHYYQVTADHFREAVSNTREVPQTAGGANSGADSDAAGPAGSSRKLQ